MYSWSFKIETGFVDLKVAEFKVQFVMSLLDISASILSIAWSLYEGAF